MTALPIDEVAPGCWFGLPRTGSSSSSPPGVVSTSLTVPGDLWRTCAYYIDQANGAFWNECLQDANKCPFGNPDSSEPISFGEAATAAAIVVCLTPGVNLAGCGYATAAALSARDC